MHVELAGKKLSITAKSNPIYITEMILILRDTYLSVFFYKYPRFVRFSEISR